MKRFLLDTSWMIAGVCGWHEHHNLAFEKLKQNLKAGGECWLAAPALIEAYSVLTRLPAPHRLSPTDAWMLLSRNFRGRGKTAYLDLARVSGLYP